MRRTSVAVLLLVVLIGGCAGSGEVVDEADGDRLEQMTRYEIDEEEVRFEAADTDVYGTLTRPEGVDDAPGVVLVAGSGPTDRDWNNPLLPGDNGTAIELAERLGEAGVAVLRYDKRGTGHTEMPGPVVWSDYLAELEGAVETIGEADGVDETRVYVGGHSEGGAHALRAAADERIDVAGLILMSTAGRSMKQLVSDQVDEQLREAGLGGEAVEAELASLDRAFERVARGDEVDSRQVSDIPGLVSIVETLQQDNARQFAAELLDWNPTTAIRRVDGPVLLVNGLKDTQIDPEADGERLHEAAEQAGVDVELALVEHADHVMKRQTIPSDEITRQQSLTYNDPARQLEEAVLAVMVEWLLGER